MIGREAFMESASQCSSGCQSGWTLYLEHSNGHQQHCSLPSKPVQRQMLQQAESDEEDCMVSDASSGPPPNPHEEEELQGHKLQQRRFLGSHCYSSSGQRSASSSGSGSGCFGSTRSRSLGTQVKISKKQRAVVQAGEAMRRHGNNDDYLDETASSSAVFSCPMRSEHGSIDVVEAVHGGGDLMDLPRCAFSAKHLQEWPAVQSTSMQGYDVHHN